MAESANSQWRNPPLANGGKRQLLMAESAICLFTKNTTKKTPKNTAKNKATTTRAPASAREAEPGDVVVVAVLAWLGFVGDAAKEPLTAETAVAWAIWLQLKRARLVAQGKEPLSITIAAWRKAHGQPADDCLRLARAWLRMNDDERRLALDTAAAPFFGLRPDILPESLQPFDIPGQTLHHLYEATHGRFLPAALLPPEPADAEASAPEPLAAPPPPGAAYEMPPETAALWQSTLDELEMQMTKATFNTWLRGSKLQLDDGGAAIVYTGNSYAADWINGRLRDTVSRTLSAVAGREWGVEARVERSEMPEGQ